ncbi:hypothetical protein NR798_47650 [Archangium gephyra]|uniref:hypothetical protein n=1 Tax=Archangium gephyra TaxID=48 RepID=UPI0035D4C708
MHTTPSRRFFWLGLPLWTGCAAMGTLQTADTVGAGKTRWSAQVMAQGVTDGGEDSVPLPRVAVEVRHGLSERVEVGARASTFGLEVSGKVELVESRGSPWAVSLAPVVGVQQLTMRFDRAMAYSEQRYAALPVLVGWASVGGSQLVLGLRPTWLYFPRVLSTPAENAFALGGSLGYAFPVGSRVRLMPEVAVMLPVGPLPTTTAMRTEGLKPHVQLGMAVMLDSGGDE